MIVLWAGRMDDAARIVARIAKELKVNTGDEFDLVFDTVQKSTLAEAPSVATIELVSSGPDNPHGAELPCRLGSQPR